MIQSKSVASRLSKGMLYLLLSIVGLLCIVPFVHIVAASLSQPELLHGAGFNLLPKGFSLDTYRYIFSTATIPLALRNTLLITVLGTALNMFMTILMAYPLAHSYLPGRRVVNFMVVFTMMFTSGMIPQYVLVRSLGLINTYAAVLFPGAINAFNLIVLRNFFAQIPPSIEESARIDGAGEWRILAQLVLPLSTASLATLTLFYAVAHWNQFRMPLLYLNDQSKWPVQILLRQMIVLSSGVGMGDSSGFETSFVVPEQSVRMATIVVSTVPILMFYPFLQRYFTKGVMMGSVKG